MPHQTILPVLDTSIRDFLLAHAYEMQGIISDAAGGMMHQEFDAGDAVSLVLEVVCDNLAGDASSPTDKQADGLACFIEACIAEIACTCSSKTRPRRFLKLDGYFTGEALEIMCAHEQQFSRIFTEMLTLYRQDEADECHVIEHTAARFLEHLEGEGCNVTPQLRQSVTEYAMLATLTVMAVELALLPPS